MGFISGVATHSDGCTLYTLLHNLLEIHNTVVVKPGEPDKERQPSQPEPSKPGMLTQLNSTNKH